MMFTLLATIISLAGTFIFIVSFYGYSIAHSGFGIIIVPFLLPWFIAIVAIFVGNALIRRLNVQSKKIIEIVLTSIVLLATISYIVIPVVIKKVDHSNLQKRSQGVVVSDIHDQPTFTKEGNLSGFKINFNVVFPEDGEYMIMTPAEDPKEINFADVYRNDREMITPQPIDNGKGHSLYKAGVLYHIEALFKPGFLISINGAPECLAVDSEDKNGYLYQYSQIKKEDAKRIINSQEPLPRKITIIIGSEGESAPSEYNHTNYVTTKSYQLKDYYDAALKEGVQPCN